ncbi:MAG TPA: alpha/beta hydrolase [Solirubrobacteraceae bacterium]|jgi:pimeloyl-ACP methyl ester carboxylesterase|nr:alpha/beta hydrolase [Solirubrobacteraceae bacterium]
MDGRAREWLQRGSFFDWTPGAQAGAHGPLKIFHAEFGDPGADALVLVHGFPTSSIDWFDVIEPLSGEYRVCLLDFPGFGFSDKPRGAQYGLAPDAELLEHYAARVLGLSSVAVVAHDRGDSVALELVARCALGAGELELNHLVITNGNVFLPLSSLTEFQRLVLNASSAPQVLAALTPEMLAAGMGASTFTPPRTPDDPAIAALAHTFAYNDGVSVLHDTIQYLVERSTNERKWLDALADSPVATAIVWGLYDTVSPLRVAAHVWERHVASKRGENEFWLLPAANHYLQHDQPDEFAAVVLRFLQVRSPQAPGPLSAAAGAPILLDRSRSELPSAESVLAATAQLEDLQGAGAGPTRPADGLDS